MTNKAVFHAQERKKSDKSSKLRKQGKIPANVYGLKKDSQSLSVDALGFSKLYASQGDTGLVYLAVDTQKQQPALIDEVAYDSVSGNILHAVFKRVNLNEVITAVVPVELVGENKISGAVVSLVKDEIEVEALPADLPDSFEIDISVLTEPGQTVTMADLSYDATKVTLVLGEDIDPATEVVVILQEVKEEVEAEDTETTEAPAETAETTDDSADTTNTNS